jgi:hypothetical protein
MPKRIRLIVTVDLDRTPGTFNTPESVVRGMQSMLLSRIGHYNPVVQFAEEIVEKPIITAILISEENLAAGGLFFMNDLAGMRVGYYYIQSTEPEQPVLYLHPRLFRKCYRFVETESPKYLRRVEEID